MTIPQDRQLNKFYHGTNGFKQQVLEKKRNQHSSVSTNAENIQSVPNFPCGSKKMAIISQKIAFVPKEQHDSPLDVVFFPVSWTQ